MPLSVSVYVCLSVSLFPCVYWGVQNCIEVQGGLERMPNPLDLELQGVLSCALPDEGTRGGICVLH